MSAAALTRAWGEDAIRAPESEELEVYVVLLILDQHIYIYLNSNVVKNVLLWDEVLQN